MTTINERLQSLIDAEGLTVNGFATELGYERSDKIYNIVKGKTKPSYEILQEITNKFVSVNIEWLISGNGEMYKGGKVQKANYTEITNAIKSIRSNLDIIERRVKSLK